jgi:hypothetical protein
VYRTMVWTCFLKMLTSPMQGSTTVWLKMIMKWVSYKHQEAVSFSFNHLPTGAYIAKLSNRGMFLSFLRLGDRNISACP